MKNSYLSVFILGLIFAVGVQAQTPESAPQIKTISVETTKIETEPTLVKEIRTMQHKGVMEGKEMKECPMKKMMKGHHGKKGGILFKVLHMIGMLIFLFIGSAVVAKGWKFGMKECCKKKK